MPNQSKKTPVHLTFKEVLSICNADGSEDVRPLITALGTRMASPEMAYEFDVYDITPIAAKEAAKNLFY